MTKVRDDFEIGVKVVERISVPNHNLHSWPLIAKSLRLLPEERVTRPIARIEAFLCGALTELRGNRKVPTSLATDVFLPAAKQLLYHGQNDPSETLKVAISPGIDPSILSQATIQHFQKWGELVGFKLIVCQIGILETVQSGQADLGIAVFSEGEDADEKLEPAIPLIAWIPHGHRLWDCETLYADQLSEKKDRVLFSSHLQPLLGDILGRISEINRVVVDCEMTRHLLLEKAGIGFGYAASGCYTPLKLKRVPVAGIEPLSLGLVLPKKRDRLTEPATDFIESLRSSLEDNLLPSIPANEELPLPEPLSA